MRRHHRHSRVRRRLAPGEYDVRARVERFAEPAVLLLLRERPAHGYELLEQLPELTGERVDMGNLYRFLRVLERDGIVTSAWDDEAPGPSKRIYELTDEGRALLDQWASALEASQTRLASFLRRYEEGR
ncbi:MAG TPA: PadR family transcriptional regulator [Gaiellaceae bacterium]|jgi:PadR family transcriptional regulator PadR|nr:PadR family transcriptional regulator [Gaiellaceae bacterium]